MQKQPKDALALPDIDFSKINSDKIYDRFADLGDFGMKRAEKGLKLGNFEVAKKHFKKNEPKKKGAAIQ